MALIGTVLQNQRLSGRRAGLQKTSSRPSIYGRYSKQSTHRTFPLCAVEESMLFNSSCPYSSRPHYAMVLFIQWFPFPILENISLAFCCYNILLILNKYFIVLLNFLIKCMSLCNILMKARLCGSGD